MKFLRSFLHMGVGVCLLFLGAPLLQAQQYLLSPVAHQQFFTNTGVVAAGYKLCTFQAGTTNNLAIASDSSGTALPNPVTLNSAGRPQTNSGAETGIYLAQTKTYKFILYASGTGNTCNGSSVGAIVWSQDNILAGESLNPICGSAISPCSTDVTGSTVTVVDTTSTLTLANASANASLLQLSINPTPVANIAASRSGSGTYPPLTFSTNGSEAARFDTSKRLLLGLTSSDAATTTSLVAGNPVTVAGATTNTFSVTVAASSGGYSTVTTDKTGTGTSKDLYISADLSRATSNLILGSGSAVVDVTGLLVTGVLTTSGSIDYASGQGRVVGIGGVTAANNNVNTSMMRMYATGGASGLALLGSDATGTGHGQPISIVMCTAGACNTGLGGGSQIVQMGLRDTAGGGVLIGSSGTVPATGGLTVTGAVVFSGIASASTGDYVCFNTGTSNITQGTAPCTTSSERFKHDIAYDGIPGLDLVRQMQPIRYIRNDHPEIGEQLGFKAEDVFTLEPRLVNVDREGRPEGFLYMNYGAVLTKALQELDAQEQVRQFSMDLWIRVIQEMEARVRVLEAK